MQKKMETTTMGYIGVILGMSFWDILLSRGCLCEAISEISPSICSLGPPTMSSTGSSNQFRVEVPNRKGQ